jgi:hypothetical protein
MTSRTLCSLLLAGGLLAGCATKPKPEAGSTPAPSPSPTPVPTAMAQPTPPAAKPTPAGPKSPWYAILSPRFWTEKIIPKKKQPPLAEAPRLIGTIKMVNKEDRFVLIDAVSYNAAQPGDALVCIVNQRESANLRANALRNPPFLIADIASGTPSPGDKVYKQ